MSKPRCENCRHHKFTNQPDSWMVICTKDGEVAHRWYRCGYWEDERMDGDKCCMNCMNHDPVYAEDPECPYVRCKITGKAVPKWDDCDEWEDEHAGSNHNSNCNPDSDCGWGVDRR